MNTMQVLAEDIPQASANIYVVKTLCKRRNIQIIVHANDEPKQFLQERTECKLKDSVLNAWVFNSVLISV